MNDVIGDRWLSVDDIAAYLGVKRDTVYKWVSRIARKCLLTRSADCGNFEKKKSMDGLGRGKQMTIASIRES